jgi:hypothetical protein
VGVRANDNHTYTVKTKADAVKALKMMQERSEEAQELMREHGISELMQEATELKKAATAFCVAKGIDKLDLGDSYAALREDGYDRRWVARKTDLGDLGNPEGAIPLYDILKSKFLRGKKKQPSKFKEIWNRITKRVVDPDALQEVIDEGLLDEDEIAAAFVEKKKAPYLRIYEKS